VDARTDWITCLLWLALDAFAQEGLRSKLMSRRPGLCLKPEPMVFFAEAIKTGKPHYRGVFKSYQGTYFG